MNTHSYFLIGSFPLTISDDELVLALATDPNDNYLLAGDTMGVISVFDISHYCIGEASQQNIYLFIYLFI